VDFKDWRFNGLDWLITGVILAEVAFALFVWSHGPVAPIPMQVAGHGHFVRWGDRTEAAFLLARSAIVAGFVFSIGKAAEMRGYATAFGPQLEILKVVALIPAISAVPILSALASAWS